MDSSEDSENGALALARVVKTAYTDYMIAKEIEKLRQEAQALKQIRESMGTEPFPQLLFNKVFKDDVIRLRSMEDMWKTRRPPEPLDYSATAQLDSREAVEKTLKDGQRVWDLQENISVFKDRYITRNNLVPNPTDRMQSRAVEQEDVRDESNIEGRRSRTYDYFR